MVSVLIVDDDLQLRKALTRALKVYGFETDSAGGYGEALACLARRPYDVVITDLRMGDRDGLDLLAALRDSSYSARPILMSAYASAKDSQRALELGAIRVLCKPFEIREMIDAIERALDSSTSYVGVVHGVSLTDMLQMFHHGRRSLLLEVLGKTVGSIALENGELVDARYGAESGELALRSILMLPAGSLRTRSLQAFTRSIHRDFQSLLLDLPREVAAPAPPPRPLPARASRLGERPLSSQPRVRSEGPLAPPPDAAQLRASRRPRPPRAELDLCCSQVVAQIPGALRCEVIDLLSAEVLGSQGAAPSDEAPPPAALLVQLFCGAPTTDPATRAPAPRFEEFQLTSPERLHLAKALSQHQALVVVSVPGGADGSLGWAQLRAALPALDAAFVRCDTTPGAASPPGAPDPG